MFVLGRGPDLEKGAVLEYLWFFGYVWLPYAMLALSFFFEWRHFGLRSRPPRMKAYILVLIPNVFMPIYVTVLAAGGDPHGRALFLALVAFLFPFISWPAVTYLTLFKRRSRKVPGRALPVGFAILSVDHWLDALEFVISV
jgi:hypothetical protein